MKNLLKSFCLCKKGNVALMWAGGFIPLITLVLGAIELTDYTRLRTSMQTAANAAVMAAFDGSERSVARNVRYANAMFDSNFTQRKKVKSLKRKLTGRQSRRSIRLTYRASAKLRNLLGDFNPLAGSEIHVVASAVYHPKSGRPPRLVYVGYGKSKGR